ncbi:MAG TPA: DHA2 family efflux MFS transporter permease subunit [Novosphingobium sp.]
MTSATSRPAEPVEADADRALTPVRHPNLLSFFILSGVIMQVLDATIANVALPHMQAALGATPESVSWVLTSYIIASAMMIPASGWLADRFGARHLFLGSVALFIASSVLCGLAANLPQMVIFRTLQGIGGASLAPLGQATMLNINRPSQQPQALATYGVGVTLGPVIGPLLGGWLTENFDWRWIFLINVPLGLVCLGGLAVLMPRIEGPRRPFDLAGWLMIACALAAFQLLLDRGEHNDWFNATESWIEAGVAVSTFWMFCVHSALSRRPLFPPALLTDRNLVMGSVFQFSMSVVQYATMALLPTMMQTLLGYPVLGTGEILSTRGVAIVSSMWLAGRLVRRVSAPTLLFLGLAAMAYSLWEMTGWNLEMSTSVILVNGMVQGFSMGFIYLPLSVILFSTLPGHLRTDAAGLINLVRNTGGSIGIAVASVMLARNLQTSHSDLAAHITPYNLAADPSLLNGFGSIGQDVMAMADGMITRQATMIAFLDDFQLMFLLSLAILPMVLFARRGARLRPGERIEIAHE